MTKRLAKKPASAGRASRSERMEKILDCAEKEFAAGGYKATPLHKIATSAKINQALLSYYFGSKEKLYQAVFLRRGRNLTRERLRLLDEFDRRTSRPPTVEELIGSFLAPAISMRYQGSGRDFLRLQARLQSEPREITEKLRPLVYDEGTLRFIEHFKAALPEIDPEAMAWRVVMMIGAYLYILSDASRLEQVSSGSADVSDQKEVVRQLSAFLTGGFKYPLDGGGRQRSLQGVRTVHP